MIRPYRTADGRIHVPIPDGTNPGNFQLKGRNFVRLKPDCSPIIMSDFDPNYSQYNDREWLWSLYTEDGVNIYGLVLG